MKTHPSWEEPSATESVGDNEKDGSRVYEDSLSTPLQQNYNGLYNFLLSFRTKKFRTAAVWQEYLTYKRSGFNSFLTTSVFISYAGYFASNEVEFNPADKSWIRTLRLFFGIFSLALIFAELLVHLIVLSTKYHINCFLRFRKRAVILMRSPHSQLMEDIAIISVTLHNIMHLLDSIPLRSKAKLSRGDFHLAITFAEERLLVIFMGIVFTQVFLRGCSRQAITCSYVIGAIFSNIIMYCVRSRIFFWINSLGILLFAVSYEFERTTLCLFLEKTIAVKNRQRKDESDWETRLYKIERDVAKKINLELQVTIANSAHDMKSPCTALTLGLECLLKIMTQQDNRKNSLDNERSLDLVRGMSQTLHSMKMSISRTMDYSKHACRMNLTPTLVSFNPLKVFELIISQIMWEESSEAIELSISPSIHFPEYIVSDEGWFEENVRCVLHNAMKYTRGSRKILASMRIETSYGDRMFFEISVQDFGCTLSKKSLKQLFDSPQQVVRGQLGGMGLGLVCLAKRVQALQGQCGARQRTDLEEGTVVWFRLPFYRSNEQSPHHDPPMRVESVSNTVAQDISVLSGLSILVVDDSASILKMVSYVLIRAGAKVSQAKNGLEAVEKTQEILFDVIITDIQMPILDGFESTREIRKAEFACGSPSKIIIGMSASADNETRCEAFTAGMDDFVAKPFLLSDMVRCYSSIVSKRKSL